VEPTKENDLKRREETGQPNIFPFLSYARTSRLREIKKIKIKISPKQNLPPSLSVFSRQRVHHQKP